MPQSKNFTNATLFLKYFILNGSLFSVIMALFDYWEDSPFSWAKFSFNFLVYGFAMGLFWYAGFTARNEVQKNKP